MDDDIFSILGITSNNANQNKRPQTSNPTMGTYDTSNTGSAFQSKGIQRQSTYQQNEENARLEREALEEIRRMEAEEKGIPYVKETNDNENDFKQQRNTNFSRTDGFNSNTGVRRNYGGTTIQENQNENLYGGTNDYDRSSGGLTFGQNQGIQDYGFQDSQGTFSPTRNNNQQRHTTFVPRNRDMSPTQDRQNNMFNSNDSVKQDDAIPEINIGKSRRRGTAKVGLQSSFDKNSNDSKRPATQNDGGSIFDRQSNFGSDNKGFQTSNNINQSQGDSAEGNQSEIETFTPTVSRRKSSRVINKPPTPGAGGAGAGQSKSNIGGSAFGKPPLFDQNTKSDINNNNFNQQQSPPNKFSSQDMQLFKTDLSDQLEKSKKKNEELEKKIEDLKKDIEQKEKELKEVKDKQTTNLKQKEEEFENQLKQIKSAHEKYVESTRENYEKQLAHERSQKDIVMKEMHEMLKLEKERIRELYDQDLKQRDQVHLNEKQQQRRNFEQESQTLKDQLQQQIKMTALAEELRLNSDKLTQITRQLNVNGYEEVDKNKLLSQKEYDLKMLEAKLENEQIFIKDEKKRLENLSIEVQNQQLELRKDIEKERRILQNEYQRVQELQDTLKNQENIKQKEILMERYNLEGERKLIDQERQQIKEEYLHKLKDFEHTTEMFEIRKQEIQNQNSALDEKFQKQLRELDVMRAAATTKEIEATKYLKVAERKEQEVQQLLEHNQQQFQKLQEQRQLLEHENLDLQKKESEFLQKQEMQEMDEDLGEIPGKFQGKLQIQQQQEEIQLKQIELQSKERLLNRQREELESELKYLDKQKLVNTQTQYIRNQQMITQLSNTLPKKNYNSFRNPYNQDFNSSQQQKQIKKFNNQWETQQNQQYLNYPNSNIEELESQLSYQPVTYNNNKQKQIYQNKTFKATNNTNFLNYPQSSVLDSNSNNYNASNFNQNNIIKI